MCGGASFKGVGCSAGSELPAGVPARAPCRTGIHPNGVSIMACSLRLMAGMGLVWLCSQGVPAAEPSASQPTSRVGKPATAAAVTDVLQAEKDGLVNVKFIPNDSRSAQIIVTNRSRKPLTLRLPHAFAGVPVAAQMGMGGMGGGMGGMGGMGGGMGGMGGGRGGRGGQTRGGGGGFGGQGMNGIGGGMGGGMGGMGGGGAFSIPPQKTRVLRVTTVCLEHGKKEPSSRMPYKLTALDQFSSDPQLTLVMASLGRGELSQKVAQAAAWHLSSRLSWERLAAEKHDRLVEPDEPFFTLEELLVAQRVVALVAEGTKVPGEFGQEAAASAAYQSGLGKE